MRGLAGASLALLLLIAPAAAGPITIEADPIEAFDPREPDRDRFGGLTFLRGAVLSSDEAHFGGISGAEISPDGSSILLLSDRANLFSAGIADGAELELRDARMHPLTGEGGGPIERDADADSESLRAADGLVPDADIFVSFERNDRVVRYRLGQDGALEAGERVDLPDEIAELPSNEGIEAVAVLPEGGPNGGSIVAIAESDASGVGSIPAWVSGPDGEFRFAIEARDDFKVTDAIALPGGDLIVLERRLALLTGLSMRVRRFDVSEIEAGADLAGEDVMTATMAYEVDNMEAVAAHRDGDGRTILTILSDDNLNSFQRTLMLQFALEE